MMSNTTENMLIGQTGRGTNTHYIADPYIIHVMGQQHDNNKDDDDHNNHKSNYNDNYYGHINN